jgi:hypothetical protein
MDKITYVFDIDGTICTQTDGNYENATPFYDRIKIVNNLYDEGHTIFFHTARGMGRNNNDGSKACPEFYTFTNKQLKSWGVRFHGLKLGKPAADIYIDDKGMKDEDFFGN